MQLLPTWTLTDRHPAFFDGESGSVIEATARVYAAVNNLITEYNTFAENANKIMNEFQNTTKEEQECFKRCITELIEKYIKSIDIKISKQDLTISNAIKNQDKTVADAVEYMKNNITETATSIINEKIANGTFNVGVVYNEETEQIEIVASEV